MPGIKISVIISTYNSPLWLQKVLWGYEVQSFTDFEIIVADDGSGEETRKLIEETAKTSTLTVKHVWHEDDGFRKCDILNKALLESSNEYVVYTDGDCIPHPELLAVHAEHARPGRFLSGGYCKLPMRTSQALDKSHIQSGQAFQIGWLWKHGFGLKQKWLKILARPLKLNTILDRISRAKKTFNGNNSSCYRKDAIEVGGLDERMGYGGEDREFGYRLENLGLSPKVIRYSALCLHLDHARGYVDQTIRQRNEQIIRHTKTTGSMRTEYGIEHP